MLECLFFQRMASSELILTGRAIVKPPATRPRMQNQFSTLMARPVIASEHPVPCLASGKANVSQLLIEFQIHSDSRNFVGLARKEQCLLSKAPFFIFTERRNGSVGVEFSSEQHFTAQVISNACKETLVEQQRLQAFALESFLADVLNQLLRCRLINDNIGPEFSDVLVS